MNTKIAFQSRHIAGLIAAVCLQVLSLSACAAVQSADPAGLQATISQNLRTLEAGHNGGYAAQNPEQHLAVGFDGKGLQLAPAAKQPAWHWGMKLQGYGVPGQVTLVQAAQVSAQGQRLEYRRGGITEWYENRPEGLEQGFTLAKPPQPNAREIELRLGADGDLGLKLDADGHGATLADRAGRDTLAYRKLDVVDARGKHLPARLTLAGNALAIRVDVQGAAWPVVVDPLIYDIRQKFTAQTRAGTDDAEAGANFGRSIALSADGSLALVGAPGAEVSGQAGAGAAYIYARGASGWTVQQKLTAQTGEGTSDAAKDAEFGYAVALSTDGSVALVGAMAATAGGKVYSGAAYLYVHGSEGWTIQQKLTAQTGDGTDDTRAGGRFGMAVALTGSGDTAAIGANGANAGSVEGAGAVYLFDRAGEGWQIKQKLYAQNTDGFDDAEPGAAFGTAVALSSDSGALLVGAYSAHADAGAAYVYKPWTDGWRIWQKLTAQKANGKDDSEPGAMFGASVALNSNGTKALVSAFMATVAGQPEAGAAYVYRTVEDKHGVETWKIRQKLVAQTANGKNDASAHAQFGKCALAGTTMLIGAEHTEVDGLAQAGSAYVYQEMDKRWRIRQKLTAQTEAGTSDAEAEAYFGVTALSASGATALTGAFGATVSGKAKAGAVYAFESPYLLTVAATAGGTVTSNPSGIDCGTTCQSSFVKGFGVTLTATPDEGYRFKGWSGGGCSGKKPCTLKINKSKTVKATFVPQR
ncbi:MAG: hypothetical protein PHT19_11225 [Methylococcus sp.]|nr:hypothetical protein [Methylococcus sp.]